jgi:hypothetical protein
MRRDLKRMDPTERDLMTLLEASDPAQKGDFRRILLRFFFVIGIVLLVALCVFTGWAIQRLSTGQSITSFDTKSSPKHPDTASIGSPVRDGQFEFLVLNITCGQSLIDTPSGKPIIAAGQFCMAPTQVRNIGSQPRKLSTAELKAHLTDGSTVKANKQAIEALSEDQKPLRWLPATSTVSLTLVFDIDLDLRITSLELHDSPLSDGAVVEI